MVVRWTETYISAALKRLVILSRKSAYLPTLTLFYRICCCVYDMFTHRISVKTFGAGAYEGQNLPA